MKKKILLIIVGIIPTIILLPISAALIYKLKFDPVFFVNEWYKFILNFVVMTSSFFLVYILWANHQINKLSNSVKQIIISRLKISVHILEECINELKMENSNKIINIVSDKLKNITPLSKEIPKFLINPIITNNKDLFLLLNTFYDSNQEFIDELTNNEFIDPSPKFKQNLLNLYSQIVELKTQIEVLHE